MTLEWHAAAVTQGLHISVHYTNLISEPRFPFMKWMGTVVVKKVVSEKNNKWSMRWNIAFHEFVKN